MPLLRFTDGRVFATGVTAYIIGGREETTEERMLLALRVEGQPTVAVVDTGAPYCVLQPELAQAIESRLTDPLHEVRLQIRGENYTGTLYLVSIELEAEEGANLSLDVTAFIPQLRPEQPWPLPSFVGLAGMLERLRFAVDPVDSKFYFGPLTGNGNQET